MYDNVPELPFAAMEQKGVEEQIAEQCPTASWVSDNSITEVGSTAARTMVSDLQADGDTQGFIAAVDQPGERAAGGDEDRRARPARLAGQEHDRSMWSQADPATAQVVTQDDVPADVDAGYVAVPHRQERFADALGRPVGDPTAL